MRTLALRFSTTNLLVAAASIVSSMSVALVISESSLGIAVASAVAFGVLLIWSPYIGLIGSLMVLIVHRVAVKGELVAGDTSLVGFADDALVVVAVGALFARAIALYVTRRQAEGRRDTFVVRALAGAAAMTLVFCIAGIAGAVLNRVPPRVLAEGLFLAIKGPLFFFAVLATAMAETARRRLILAAGAIAGAIFLSGVVQVAIPGSLDFLPGLVVQERVGLTAAAGLLAHPGMFGWFMATAAAVSGVFALRDRRLVYYVASGVFGLGSLLSLRAKPLLGLAAVFFVAVFVEGRRLGRSGATTRRDVMLLAATLGVIAFTFSPFGSRAMALLEAQTATYVGASSESARVAMYDASVTVAAEEFPVGAGFGRFGSHTAYRHYSPLYYELGLNRVWGLGPRNGQFATDFQWPGILGETGVIGVAGFAGFLGLVLLVLWRGASQSRWAFLALLVLVESLVESIALPIYTNTFPAIVVFALAGIGCGDVLRRARSRAPADQPPEVADERTDREPARVGSPG